MILQFAQIKFKCPLMNSAKSFMSFGEIPNMSLDFFVFTFKSNFCTSSRFTSFKKKLMLIWVLQLVLKFIVPFT